MEFVCGAVGKATPLAGGVLNLSGLIIAIDGPAGSGKSTVARLVAEHLGITYIDTGAMYRAIALKALRMGVSWDDEAALTDLAESCRIKLAGLCLGEGEVWQSQVLLDGEDVSNEIRTHHISEGASRVSAWPGVRQALLDKQREFARRESVVMDGRDIGTIVLPHAQVKIFLTASLDERTRRRVRELAQRGREGEAAFEQIRADLQSRDANDSGRAVAPLKPAVDAILLDTTLLSIPEVVQRIIEIAETADETAESDAQSRPVTN